jgi:hypothetical protein
LGLTWLEARGIISLAKGSSSDEFILCAANKASFKDPKIILDELEDVLRETAAYRDYFSRADANLVLHLPLKA